MLYRMRRKVFCAIVTVVVHSLLVPLSSCYTQPRLFEHLRHHTTFVSVRGGGGRGEARRSARATAASPSTATNAVSHKVSGGQQQKRLWSRKTALSASSLNINDDNDDKSQLVSKKEAFRRQGMAAALFGTYFTVMGAKCALPSVLSLLTSRSVGLSFAGWSSKPQYLMAQVLALSTLAVAIGKLSLGPVIDRFGGVLSLQVCLAFLLLAMVVIASSTTFTTFAVAWVVVDFVFSSCWAGCINAVHQSFPEEEWAGRVGMLAAAARTGNAAAFLVFARVLQWCENHLPPDGKSWKVVFWVSAVLQVIPLALLGWFGRIPADLSETTDVLTSLETRTNSKGHKAASLRPLQKQTRRRGRQPTEKTKVDHPPTGTKSSSAIATLWKVARTGEFWLHMVSRSALMLFGSFLLFVPTLMTKVYGVTDAQAAQVGSIFALGCLLSVSTGSESVSRLGKWNRIRILAALVGVATLCCVTQLAHLTGVLTLSGAVSTGTFFLWGLSFAIPFYIPPSLYALKQGGKDGSATIADAFDFSGFLLLAFFNGYVASIRHDVLAAWIPTFQILTGCGVASLVSLSFALLLDRENKG